MKYLAILVVATLLPSYGKSDCMDVDTIDRSLNDAYCDQPLFVNFAPKTEEIQLIDNICYTFFPLPDDPDTYQLYVSRVFCDGSNDITSLIATQFEIGTIRKANPYITLTDYYFGYAGCDTYLLYRCTNFESSSYGDEEDELFVYGLSPQCRAIGLSCLRKVEEIVSDNGLPEIDYYVLPMKLPNRCVTQQLCLQPPNPFYNQLPAHTIGHTVTII